MPFQTSKKKVRINVLSEYSEVVENRDMQKMQVAQMTNSDAFNILRNEYSLFEKFVLSKIVKFENVKTVEDFPKGEEVEEEDNNETVLGYSFGFLLIYLIEYFLLSRKPEALEAYLKAIRIPQAAKYSKDLQKIFKSL